MHQSTSKSKTVLDLGLFLVGLLASVFFIQRYLGWLYSFEYPLDFSGFYYLVELRSWAESGAGYYHNSSFFFAILGSVARLGFSPLEILNAVIVVSYIGTITALAFTASKLMKSWGWSACFAAILFSLTSLFLLSYGYPRQMLSICFLAWGLALHYRFGSEKFKQAQLALFISAALSHLLGAGLCALVLIFISLDKFKKTLLAAAISGILAWHLLDIPRNFDGVIQLQGSTASSLIFENGGISLKELKEHQLALGLALCLLLVQLLYSKPSVLGWGLLGSFFLLSAPIWDLGLNRYGIRALRFSLYFFFLYYLSALKDLEAKLPIFFLNLLPCVFLLSANFNQKFETKSEQIGPTFSVQSLVNRKEALQKLIPEDAIIIAPHGVQFQLTYFLRRAATRSSTNATELRPIFVLSKKENRDRCLEPLGLQELSENDCVIVDEGHVLRKFRKES